VAHAKSTGIHTRRVGDLPCGHLIVSLSLPWHQENTQKESGSESTDMRRLADFRMAEVEGNQDGQDHANASDFGQFPPGFAQAARTVYPHEVRIDKPHDAGRSANEHVRLAVAE
jgi:hypothetical protein